jgi:hypothetical protein
MKRYVLALLLILGITNVILYQVTYIISVDARDLNVRVSSEDFWKTFGPLLKLPINGTIEDDE